MPSYDIRLLKPGNGKASVYQTIESSDLAAVCTGQKLAEQGYRVEVWRGMHCIYAAQEDINLSLPWASSGYPAPARANA